MTGGTSIIKLLWDSCSLEDCLCICCPVTFPRTCWRAQAQVPWIPEFCWCLMGLGHRSCLFSAVAWKGCSVPLCCLRKTNPALLVCHRAACPGPVPALFSSLRSVSLPSPCSLALASWWQTQHSAYISSCCFASTALFGPSSLQRKGFYMWGCVLEDYFFVVWLFSTAENPVAPACASVSRSVTAVL